MTKKILVMTLFTLILSGLNLMANVDQTADYVNIAADQTVYSSSNFANDYSAKYAVDANPATVWGASTKAGDQWIYIDLRQDKYIDRVEIEWFDQYYAVEYKTAISSDAKTWTFIDEELNGQGGTKIIDCKQNARYVGALFTVKKSLTYAIKEFKVFGDRPTKETFDRVFGGNKNDNIQELHMLADGTMLATAFSDSTNFVNRALTGRGDIFILKLDDRGLIEWIVPTACPSVNRAVTTISSLPGENLYQVEITSKDADTMIIKIDLQGTIIEKIIVPAQALPADYSRASTLDTYTTELATYTAQASFYTHLGDDYYDFSITGTRLSDGASITKKIATLSLGRHWTGFESGKFHDSGKDIGGIAFTGQVIEDPSSPVNLGRNRYIVTAATETLDTILTTTNISGMRSAALTTDNHLLGAGSYSRKISEYPPAYEDDFRIFKKLP